MKNEDLLLLVLRHVHIVDFHGAIGLQILVGCFKCFVLRIVIPIVKCSGDEGVGDLSLFQVKMFQHILERSAYIFCGCDVYGLKVPD